MFIFASSSGVWGDGVGGVESQKSQLFQENLFALLGANFIPVRVGTLHFGRTILSRETASKSFKFFFLCKNGRKYRNAPIQIRLHN